MINLELPKKIEDTRALLRQFSRDGLRPLSRKYDLAEQKEMPEELYELSKLLRARPSRGKDIDAQPADSETSNRNGNNLSMVVSSAEEIRKFSGTTVLPAQRQPSIVPRPADEAGSMTPTR